MFRAIFNEALRYLMTTEGFVSPKHTYSTPFLQNLKSQNVGVFFFMMLFYQLEIKQMSRWQNCTCNTSASPSPGPSSQTSPAPPDRFGVLLYDLNFSTGQLWADRYKGAQHSHPVRDPP